MRVGLLLAEDVVAGHIQVHGDAEATVTGKRGTKHLPTGPSQPEQGMELVVGDHVNLTHGDATVLVYERAAEAPLWKVWAKPGANARENNSCDYRAKNNITITGDIQPKADHQGNCRNDPVTAPTRGGGKPVTIEGGADAIARHKRMALKYEASGNSRKELEEYESLLKEAGLDPLSPPAWMARRIEAAKSQLDLASHHLSSISQQPVTYALVVGVGNYPWLSETQQLQGAVEDARQFREYLLSPRGAASADTVTLLLNEQATTAAIRLNLQRVTQLVQKDDHFVFFVSGHGAASGREGYIAAYDSRLDVANTMLPASELVQSLATISREGAQVLVFADICDAGAVKQDWVKQHQASLRVGGFTGLLASESGRAAHEDKIGKQGEVRGVFSYYLLDALVAPSPIQCGASSGKTDSLSLGCLRELVNQGMGPKYGQRSVPFGQVDLPIADLSKSGNGPTPGGQPQHPADLSDPMQAARELLASRTEPETEAWQKDRAGLLIQVEQEAQEVILRYLAGDELPPEKADYQSAEQLFSAALLLDPHNTDIRANRSFCAAMTKIRDHPKDWDADFYEAQSLIEQAIADNPEASYFYNARGMSLLEHNVDPENIMQAKACFQEAMLLDPYWSYPRFNLALTYQLTGREDAKARAAYDEAIRYSRFYGMNSGYLLHNLGVFLERRQEWDEAAEAFSNAAADLLGTRNYLDRIAPHTASPATTGGWMMRREALGRSAAEAYNSLGALYAVEGFTARARTAFHQALNLDPDLDSAARNLGQLFLNASGKLLAAGCCPSLSLLSANDQERLLVALGRTEYYGGRARTSSQPNKQSAEEDKRLVDTCPCFRPALAQFSHSNIARKAATP